MLLGSVKLSANHALSPAAFFFKNGLSGRFRTIMERAGIKDSETVATGEAGRTRRSKGYHSLRHTFISLLANAGVAPEVRKKLTAHSDEAVHSAYSHLEVGTFRTAVEKIPSLL